MRFLLLGTAGCHLCEEAEAILDDDNIVRLNIKVDRVDIAEKTQWQAEFATSIPVLLQPDCREFIAWPFDQADVLTFIQRNL
jgi:hypothetical protein